MNETHRWVPVAVCILLAAATVPAVTGADPLLIEGQGRAFFIAIQAEEGTVVKGEWRTRCPPDHSCARYTTVKFPGEHWWSADSKIQKGDLGVFIKTPLGNIQAPIANGTSPSRTLVVELDHAFEEAGTALLAGIATDPWTISLESSDGMVTLSFADEVHWYRPSEFPAVVESKLVLPGVSVAGNLEWTAHQGSFGVFLSTPIAPGGVVGYQREGPMGSVGFCALEPICLDRFWGPPGDYRMSYAAMFDTYDAYMAGWADMAIPADPCNGWACGVVEELAAWPSVTSRLVR